MPFILSSVPLPVQVSQSHTTTMDNNSKIQAVARGLTLGGALPLVPALVACSVVALTAWLAYRFRPRASDARSVLSKSEWTTFPLESRKALSRNAVLFVSPDFGLTSQI